MNSSVKEPNMSHNYKTEKITCKASGMAENLQLYSCSVLPPEIVMHDAFNVYIRRCMRRV